MGIGLNIKERRKKMGLTLQGLADKTESSKSYIWELEQDKDNIRPSAEKVHKIAEALEVTAGYLFCGGNDADAEDKRFFSWYMCLDKKTKTQIKSIAKILANEK